MKCVGFAWKKVCRSGYVFMKSPKKEKQCNKASCSTPTQKKRKSTKAQTFAFLLVSVCSGSLSLFCWIIPHQTTKTRLKRQFAVLPDRHKKKRLQIPSFRCNRLKVLFVLCCGVNQLAKVLE